MYPKLTGNVLPTHVYIRVPDGATLATVTDMPDGGLAYIPSMGFFEYQSTNIGVTDGLTYFPSNAGGGWLQVAADLGQVFAMMMPELQARDEALTYVLYTIIQAHNDLVAKYNDLATQFIAHKHPGVTTGSGTSGTFNTASTPSTSAKTLTKVDYTVEG